MAWLSTRGAALSIRTLLERDIGLRSGISTERTFHQYGHHPGCIIVGMSEEKKFCPKCKAMTMEPAEGIHITPEELNQMGAEPSVFAGKLTPYQCPICLHFAYQPVF